MSLDRDVTMTQRQLVGKMVTVLALLALAALVCWFVWAVSDILVLLLVSAILAAGFAPLVEAVEGSHLLGGLRCSRGAAIFVLFLAIFGAIALILSLIVVPAFGEAGRFAERFPQELARIRAWLVDLRLHRSWLPDLARMLDRAAFQASRATRLDTEPVGVAFRVAGWIGSATAVLVLTFYMLLEGSAIKQGVLALVPAERRGRASLMLDQIGTKFGAWLRGQLLLCFLVAAPVAVGLMLLGMPYPFLLGLIAGAGELIPVVGPTVGAAVAIAVALSEPVWRLIAVVVFYLVVLNVEPSILVPRIMAHEIGLSPLLTLTALLIGVKLMGPLGGLLAVAAVLQVIAYEVVREIGPAPIPREPPVRRDRVAARPLRGLLRLGHPFRWAGEDRTNV
jgi:predicted PurR-regulated permease PerM